MFVIITNENGSVGNDPPINFPWPHDLKACPDCGSVRLRLSEDAQLYRYVTVADGAPITEEIAIEVCINVSPDIKCNDCGWYIETWDMEKNEDAQLDA